jgi:hypothetical protein
MILKGSYYKGNKKVKTNSQSQKTITVEIKIIKI